MERDNEEATEPQAPAWDIGGAAVHERSRSRRLGRGPAASAGPPRRSGMAFGNKLGSAQSRRRGAPDQGALAARRLCRRNARRRLRANIKRTQNPSISATRSGSLSHSARVGAWTSRPSVYAVAAKTKRDVVAAVKFARTNDLRLVVRGGGHGCQGTSNSANSLLIWTRHMNAIVLHNAFVRCWLRRKRGAATRGIDRAGALSGDRPMTR